MSVRSQLENELLACGKDPVYFILNYVKISTPMKGVIPFALYPFQKDMIHRYRSNQFNIILKARQLGASTTTAAYALWLLLFHRGRQVDVIATQRKTAAELVLKTRSMYDELPDWMQKVFPMGFIDNQHEFRLKNGSRMCSHASNGDIRGIASSLLILDEAAHIDQVDKVLEAALPVLSTGGSCIAISTPNGLGNWFEKTYTKAIAGEGGFFPIKLDWRVHPDRDEVWYEKNLALMGQDKFSQEYECDFLSSGRTFLDPKIIKKLNEEKNEPQYCVGLEGNTWIWQEPDPYSQYYISADISRGDGEDYTAFQVLNKQTLEQVCEFQGRIPADLAAIECVKLAKDYNDALIIAENNSYGWMFLNKIIEDRYENIFYSEKGTYKYVPIEESGWRTDILPGVTTTLKSRDMILSTLEEFVRKEYVKINSERLIKEFESFRWTNKTRSKVEAINGQHDDLIMAFAIACWAYNEINKTYEIDIQYDKAILDAISFRQKRIAGAESVIGINPNNLSVSVASGDATEDYKKKINKKRSWIII